MGPGERSATQYVTALAANEKGEIFDLEGYAALGMSGNSFQPLTLESTKKIPQGSELMYLPDRKPIYYNIGKGKNETLEYNPFNPEEPIYPVSAFNSPGYVITANPAYEERENTGPLPLFFFFAAGWYKDGFRTAVCLVDREPRQDLRRMPEYKVVAGTKRMRKKYPDNRLIGHVEGCALTHGCPAAKNFFIGRYEAPLPTSIRCNANCVGCISLQKDKEIPCCQERISFTPTPEEIAELALEHIGRVEKSVVSFGQGCEGDPLTAAKVIEPAIRLIRSRTEKGTLNLNTNAGDTANLRKLIDAGLDSIRVSLNSARKKCYEAYFRPKSYHFHNVLKSIDLAAEKGLFVSVNYLNMPGITDSPEEYDAFRFFLENHAVNYIQWRNLNFDPLRYWALLNQVESHGKPLGIVNVISLLKKINPYVGHGYFNPPKENFV